MRVKLTEAGKKIAEQLEIPEIVRAKFYFIFNNPNEYRVYYRNLDDFKEQISDCCFGC